jgi:hypothetical protein
MTVSPFKDRFSLSWLATSSEATSPSPTSSNAAAEQLNPQVEAVFSLVGNQVLSILQKLPDQKDTLLNIASASSVRLDALLPVMQYLLSKGAVERVVEDPSGNDTYKISPSGPTRI